MILEIGTKIVVRDDMWDAWGIPGYRQKAKEIQEKQGYLTIKRFAEDSHHFVAPIKDYQVSDMPTILIEEDSVYIWGGYDIYQE